jgi:hypothetical protein
LQDCRTRAHTPDKEATVNNPMVNSITEVKAVTAANRSRYTCKAVDVQEQVQVPQSVEVFLVSQNTPSTIP